MPFVSQKQRRWMYANDPEMARRWEHETPKGALPERKGKKKTKKKKRVVTVSYHPQEGNYAQSSSRK